MIDPTSLLTERQAIERLARLGIEHTSGTMRQQRIQGRGPAFYLVGTRVRYPVSEIDRYATGLISPLMRSTRIPVAAEARAAA